MADLAEYARRSDPFRLISAACLVDTVNLRIADRLEAHLDVIGLNEYYGWYDPDYTKLSTIPVSYTHLDVYKRQGGQGVKSLSESVRVFAASVIIMCLLVLHRVRWCFAVYIHAERCPPLF